MFKFHRQRYSYIKNVLSRTLFVFHWPVPVRFTTFNLMGCLAIVLVIFLSYQHFALTSSNSWGVTLNLSTEESFYYTGATLLTVRVMPENQTGNSISFDGVHGAYRLTVREVPEGLLEHTMLDVGRGKLIADKNFMPANGFKLMPQIKFQNTFSIVLPIGIKVAIGAELTRDDEFVKVGKFVHIARLNPSS